MQLQVQILISCPKCEGEAYAPDELITCEACFDCGGIGRQKIWIDLTDLLVAQAEHYPVQLIALLHC